MTHRETNGMKRKKVKIPQEIERQDRTVGEQSIGLISGCKKTRGK